MEVNVAVAAVERLRQEAALVLGEDVPVVADAHGHMETQHGLELMVGAERLAAHRHGGAVRQA